MDTETSRSGRLDHPAPAGCIANDGLPGDQELKLRRAAETEDPIRVTQRQVAEICDYVNAVTMRGIFERIQELPRNVD